MKLYTKTGDDGSTGLFGGARVQKDDCRVVAYGTVDETNAAIGLCAAVCTREETLSLLRQIQSDLFILGGELATAAGATPKVAIADDRIAQLERWIDEACADVPALKTFVLPGGCELAARLHYGRTVCRRAERDVVSLAQKETVSSAVVIYLNRLSDLLFALARAANHRAGVADIPWPALPQP